ncbi:MAG: hypothetical protein LUH05_03115 [Candidatus Gastranaerophilales bacterium]|nr:hypothetical protein [Candidatus Gastranaerophilales bacterium]
MNKCAINSANNTEKDTGNPLNLNLQEAINYHEEIFNKHLTKPNKNYVLPQFYMVNVWALN